MMNCVTVHLSALCLNCVTSVYPVTLKQRTIRRLMVHGHASYCNKAPESKPATRRAQKRSGVRLFRRWWLNFLKVAQLQTTGLHCMRSLESVIVTMATARSQGLKGVNHCREAVCKADARAVNVHGRSLQQAGFHSMMRSLK